MSLKEEISTLIGNRRRFLLFRIADVDTDTARKLCGIKKGTYNTWLKDKHFVGMYRRRNEWSAEYKKEAISLLRRDNQLAAVLLEEKIITRMQEEIETGEYNLIRTHLAREVYSKLINDLDVIPQVSTISWEQRVQALFLGNRQEAVDGQYETISSKEEEHPQGYLPSSGEPKLPKGQEEV